MKLVSIFVENFEGLHSVHYHDERLAEYYRLFELWNDVEYLLEYCQRNQEYIYNDFWKVNRLEEFIDMIQDEAEKLEDFFLSFKENGLYVESGVIQQIFIPLNNHTTSVPSLQESKAKLEVSKPKLRFYAIRINKNTFIHTGGCIKLTHRMEEHPDSQIELNKIISVKEWLKIEGIKNEDDLSYYYEQ